MLECENLVDLSQPDNSLYDKGRKLWVRLLWHFVGFPIVHCYWLPVSSIKVRVLRLFGAKIGRGAYLKPGLKIKFPWYLSIGDNCWLGEDAWLDNLTHVTIGSNVCISQGAYLCTGNHDWSDPNFGLMIAPIRLANGSWAGAKCILTPGTVLGEGAVVGAGSVVTGNIPDYQIYAGNPAVFVRRRTIRSVPNHRSMEVGVL